MPADMIGEVDSFPAKPDISPERDVESAGWSSPPNAKMSANRKNKDIFIFLLREFFFIPLF